MTDDLPGGVAFDDVGDGFLVSRAADGDLRAFSALLRRHNRTLRRYVERITRNPADTDDVLQETALVAWRHLDGVREPEQVRAWLIRVATREALRHLRDRPPTAELTEDAAPVSAADAGLERLDLRSALQDVLDALPRQQAQCWTLRELGGYSYGEIAEELDIPESTVRGALVQARRTVLRTMGGAR